MSRRIVEMFILVWMFPCVDWISSFYRVYNWVYSHYSYCINLMILRIDVILTDYAGEVLLQLVALLLLQLQFLLLLLLDQYEVLELILNLNCIGLR
jgi:hypothetical protein